MADYIEPRILKGFRDFLPAAEIARRNLIEKIETVFRSYGFVPIDTPALEYAEILLGKGGGETEKQIYRFSDNGGRDVALRFDLTVPFARFLAEHRAELGFPFKRYHIAKVWRGENTQRGRYREFTQCDFDIVGSGSAAADFEILHMMRNTLLAVSGGTLGDASAGTPGGTSTGTAGDAAAGTPGGTAGGVPPEAASGAPGGVIIRLNHRGLFNRFLSRLGVLPAAAEILRTVDKLAKIGREKTLALLTEAAGEAAAKEILDYIGLEGGFDETLAAMTAAATGSSAAVGGGGANGRANGCEESDRLSLIRRYMNDSGTAASFVLDPSITRGLDYYTGVVFESFLVDMPEIGSICSGGRYDNLVGLYTKNKNPREDLSGVGASIGIDRLIAALEALGRLETEQSYARTAIACVDEAGGGAYQALAEKLRKEGIPCEVFLDPVRNEEKLTKQFQAAEKKGFRWLIIPDGGQEPGADQELDEVTLRDLAKRENRENLTVEEAAGIIKSR